MVRALRLHVEVQTDEENGGQNKDPAQEPKQQPAEFLHAGKLRNAGLKKR
jgi:hypothetical protein